MIRALLPLTLLGCTAPVRVLALPDGDPLLLSRALADDLSAYDALVGSHPHVSITLESVGRGQWQRGTDLGECRRVNGTQWLTLDLDAIQATPWPRQAFRHALWHELRHAQLTCTDADHSADPTALMYPTLSERNLEARP